VTDTGRRDAPHHNTLTCYTNYRCRRPECVQRKREWHRMRDQARSAGTWQPFVDAEPVRQHLRKLLAAGFTQDRIAALSGVNHQTIADFTHHTRKIGRRALRYQTSRTTAEKLLAVSLTDHSPVHVDPTSSRRRLQALVAIGWPLVHIDRQLGLPRGRSDRTFRCNLIRIETKLTLAEGYEHLRHLTPERNGVPARHAKSARARAAAKRWPKPEYWDQYADVIDDPHFEPLYGVSRREIVAQDASWVMRTTGVDKATAAARLGVSKAYVEHALRDHPEYAVEVAA
jgi:hypothetical protein